MSIEAAEFQRSVDAHQDGLRGGALLGTIALAVPSQDHGWSDHPLGEVIVERDLRLIQERPQVIGRPEETLRQSARVRILIVRNRQRIKPLMDQHHTTPVPLARDILAFAQADRVANQPAELLGERAIQRHDYQHQADYQYQADDPYGVNSQYRADSQYRSDYQYRLLRAEAAAQATAMITIDESPTRLRITGEVNGLPKIERILEVLVQAGAIGVERPRVASVDEVVTAIAR